MLQAKENEIRALELRKKGLSYLAIGREMGLSESGAHGCVTRALKALRAEAAESAEDVRDLELQRLDRMLTIAEAAAEAGDLSAIDRVLRIQERRAKYLGLDAPTRTDVRAEVVARQDLSHLDDDRLAQIERLLRADPDA